MSGCSPSEIGVVVAPHFVTCCIATCSTISSNSSFDRGVARIVLIHFERVFGGHVSAVPFKRILVASLVNMRYLGIGAFKYLGSGAFKRRS